MEFRKISFYKIADDLIEGVKSIHEEMNEKGLLNESTTFEEMADYAGKHVLISERSETDGGSPSKTLGN